MPAKLDTWRWRRPVGNPGRPPHLSHLSHALCVSVSVYLCIFACVCLCLFVCLCVLGQVRNLSIAAVASSAPSEPPPPEQAQPRPAPPRRDRGLYFPDARRLAHPHARSRAGAAALSHARAPGPQLSLTRSCAGVAALSRARAQGSQLAVQLAKSRTLNVHIEGLAATCVHLRR